MEYGTHEELMEEEGIYFQLMQEQNVEGGDGESRLRGRHTRARTLALPNAPKIFLSGTTPRIVDETGGVCFVEDDFDQVVGDKNRLVFRAISLLRPDALIVSMAILLAIMNGAVMPVFALLLSEIVDAISGLTGPGSDEATSRVRFWALFMLGLGVVTGVIRFLQQSTMGVAGERLARRLRVMCFHAMLRQEIGWFDDKRHRVGVLATRLATDPTMVHNLVSVTLCSVISMVSSFAVSIIIGATGSW
jgi:ABC-type multidrug transport system fused ATPase/permease subunit